jgi:hypothetical protein
MSNAPEDAGPVHLVNRHRDSLLPISQHPTSHNVEWHAVLSLLEAVGTVEVRHDKFEMRVGTETEVFSRPKSKDIDDQQIVDLRLMLTNAGYGELVGG